METRRRSAHKLRNFPMSNKMVCAVSYNDLLTVFWDRLNPTTLNQQGNDIGTQYRSAYVHANCPHNAESTLCSSRVCMHLTYTHMYSIYYHNEDQRRIAEESKEREQAKYTLPIVTEISPASKFYPAEDYHQQYLEKGGQCAAKGDTTAIRCYG